MIRALPTTQPGSRAARHDARWPAIAAALADLRERGRFAVRIVEADCGAGSLLLHAVQHARRLGFTAIEGRGIDRSPALIVRARAAAKALRDPAIGVIFDSADVTDALRDEHDLPADLIIWNGRWHGDVAAALSRAGDRVIPSPCTAPPRSKRGETGLS
ncbi:hypothetical protein ASF00_06995 [Sphingomonas sp. Leaf34]|nr:hypothetical protein ASF00_06995 [Sphingomonas sp. Leaf34]KQN32904.1 hypothetical protein ASE88_02785 [Sphingomonas sp. Leaf38]